MPLKDSYLLPAAADFHVHLRDKEVSKVVVPTVAAGGVDVAYVMPNLVPPVTTVSMAMEYRDRLRAISPDINYLMTLYLHPSITPEVIREAKAAGISGVKSYPQGLTTNSQDGVVSYEPFFDVFRAMEETDMVLNIHGEAPSDSGANVTVLNAEDNFLPTLRDLHRRFPRLRIVMEHMTTAAACEAVRSCGETVVGTITAHHLSLLVDDFAGDVFNYCKPVAKTPADRRALLNAAVYGNGKFFLGTDSAPHDISAKKGPGKASPGVFTQAYAVQYVLTALEEAIERGDIPEGAVTEEVLRGFLGEWGRKFYKIGQSTRRILLTRGQDQVVESFKGHGVEIVPFRAGERTWGLKWVE